MLGIFLLSSFLHVSLSEDSYPDINELFPRSKSLTNVSSVATFDISQLDVGRLKSEIESFNTSQEEIAADTRRQVLIYKAGQKWWYMKASEHMVRSKTLDLMLQLIYMARDIMKQLEKEPTFNNKDTGYRIGYLYRKLRMYWRYVNDVYAIMRKRSRAWNYVENHLKLHHKAVKIHTDFLNYYWVLIKLDGKYREFNADRQKLPKSLVPTGGVAEDKYRIG